MENVNYEILPTQSAQNIDKYILILKEVTGHEDDTELHWHEGIEITLVLEGTVDYLIAGKQLRISKGSIAFVNSGVIHQAQQPSFSLNNLVCILVIPDSVLTDLVPEVEKPYFLLPEASPERSIIATYMYQIAHYMAKETPYRKLLIRKELLALIYQLFSRCYSPTSIKSTDNKFAHKVIEYVNKNYAYPLSIEAAAAHFGLQKNYFCRRFKQETGFSFHNFLSRVRLDAALALLSTDNYSALECALEVGFSSEKTLIDWCNKIYHCTPMNHKHLSK